jgi:hypothetical protein
MTYCKYGELSPNTNSLHYKVYPAISGVLRILAKIWVIANAHNTVSMFCSS